MKKKNEISKSMKKENVSPKDKEIKLPSNKEDKKPKKKKTVENEEYRVLVDKEKKKNELNTKRNKPILLITYMFAGLFLFLMGYVVKFMVVDKDNVISNSYNKRQDNFVNYVTRGDIITSDGVVVATNQTNSDGSAGRYYPYSNMFAHAVGFSTYGKSGIELSGNYYLLTSSSNIFEKVFNDLKEEKNIGDNLITTLNYNLQSAAYEALGNANGAVVVMEPDTGKILAMVSKPDFNPNDIDNVWEQVTSEDSSENSILLNRATQGLYPPGSTFKVITMLEYIREHNDYEDYSYVCESEGIYNSVSIRCAGGKTHGEVSLGDSLAYSCNTSFSNIGTTLNIKKYNQLCTDLLFNNSLPYDGVYKKSSFVLTSNSDKSEIPQTVIGQGNTQITPLHNALIMSSIANGGVMMKPYLIDSIENHDGANVKKFTSKSYKKVITTDESALLIDYLRGVCEYGTASSTFSGTSYTVAGKTGTAEFNNEGKAHSWFVGFSNVDNPDIVVSVVIEDSTDSGVTGTQVAKKIFDAYYR